MSGSVEDFDGLCGIIYIGATSARQIRCKYEFGHHGPHSYEKENLVYHVTSGITLEEIEKRAVQGSIAAQALLAVIKK